MRVSRRVMGPLHGGGSEGAAPPCNEIVYRGHAIGGVGKALFMIDANGSLPPQRLTDLRESGVDADPYWGPTP